MEPAEHERFQPRSNGWLRRSVGFEPGTRAQRVVFHRGMPGEASRAPRAVPCAVFFGLAAGFPDAILGSAGWATH